MAFPLRHREMVIKTPAKKTSDEMNTRGLSDTARILNHIKRSKKGLDVPTLRIKTGFDEKKIRNVIYKAFKEGVIKRAGRGIYLSA